MENGALFVSGEWLQARLEERSLRLIQVGGEGEYARLHLPGAVLVGYAAFTTMRDGLPGMRAEDEVLAALFGRLGIEADTPVVAYDLVGGTDAARFAWSLACRGHRGGCRLLDGGLQVWYQEQRPLTTVVPVVESVVFEASVAAAVWEAERDEVLAVVEGRGEAMLVDTRSRNEYVGLSLRGPRGHLAGAVHWDWIEALAGRQDPRLQPVAQLRARLAAIGVQDPACAVITYCETAHRAAHTWMVLRHLGWERVRLYDGSMSEWRLCDLPVVAGDSPR